jgi:hypothetical protein
VSRCWACSERAVRLDLRTFDDGLVAFDPLTCETHSFSSIAGYLLEFSLSCGQVGTTLGAVVESCAPEGDIEALGLTNTFGEALESLIAEGWLVWS